MLDFNFHVTTPRLYITYMDSSNPKHLAMVAERFPDPDFTPEKATHWIDGQRERLETTGWGRYIILLRPDAEVSVGGAEPTMPFSERRADLNPVGAVSMQYMRFAETPGPLIPDVGFWLAPRARGKGYAAEAAAALMGHFEHVRGFKAFAGYTDVENGPSRRLLKSLGMEEVGISDLDGVRDSTQGPDRCVVFVKGVEGGKEALEKLGIIILEDA